MPRGIVWAWCVAMLLAVVGVVWPAERRRSTDLALLGATVDGGVEEHPPRLATGVEVLEEGSILRRGALIEIGGQQVASIQRPRARPVRRTARGPPGRASSRCMNERPITREEKTC